ncbi:hypothetical protein V493_00866 [Pseudogymnoascus sp. VKM F-4281 (FW-2241)]|nr:hypothetical protein V493_00866 [Pseudogymnoascus sp. VKM F-4281 (FW-2241)]
MKRRAIDELVYEHMFPHPKPTDPQNWAKFLERHLLTEVRQETACFYGSLDTREAQYPGLDYSYPPHRMRLSRFTWHRRLFRAFDTLRLTESEIAGLTHWEGTRWAKERFEKEQNFKIRDTTGDCIQDWVDPTETRPEMSSQPAREAEFYEFGEIEENEGSDDPDQMDEDGEESDVEVESVGVELNRRLRAGFSDEEYEQWLKEAAEAGGVSVLPGQSLPLTNAVPSQASVYTRVPPSIINAILQGNGLRNGAVSSTPRREASASTSSTDRTSGPNAASPVESRPSQLLDSLPSLRLTSSRTTHPATNRAPGDRTFGQGSSRPPSSF